MRLSILLSTVVFSAVLRLLSKNKILRTHPPFRSRPICSPRRAGNPTTEAARAICNVCSQCLWLLGLTLRKKYVSYKSISLSTVAVHQRKYYNPLIFLTSTENWQKVIESNNYILLMMYYHISYIISLHTTSCSI